MLPGLVIQSEPKRLYPAGKSVAHLVGYVSEVTEADLSADRYPGAVPRAPSWARRGSSGSTTTRLRGAEGVRYIEVNARGRLVREEASIGLAAADARAIRSSPRSTSISSASSTASGPPGVRGAMVAMTPKGEVRALYSAPTLRPQRTSSAASPSAEWRRAQQRSRPGRCSTG